MLMYCDLWSKEYKIEQQTGLARDFAVFLSNSLMGSPNLLEWYGSKYILLSLFLSPIIIQLYTLLRDTIYITLGKLKYDLDSFSGSKNVGHCTFPGSILVHSGLIILY